MQSRRERRAEGMKGREDFLETLAPECLLVCGDVRWRAGLKYGFVVLFGDRETGRVGACQLHHTVGKKWRGDLSTLPEAGVIISLAAVGLSRRRSAPLGGPRVNG
ncbi:hypothetical protein E2C01_021312 [Portunus trituberculatus]|uniref:Uncharacterized protein n=1 Tax=Portunus trituberculatus TaxID=210409 RepID=A0A5B7E439_PORTR|nr:hypothetical protein [Portunus trituberculatus]